MKNAYNTSAYGSFAYVYDIFMEIVEDEPPKENEGVTFSEDKDYLAEYLELYLSLIHI